MFTSILIIALSIMSVQSHRRVVPPVRGRHVSPNVNAVIISEPCIPNPPMVPPRRNEVIVTETIIPSTISPATGQTLIPFITELPTCPDLCFKDILKSPLGCLDPILDVYSKTAVPVNELAAGPFLAAAAPPSRVALASLPGCDCKSHFLERLSIPPPFI